MASIQINRGTKAEIDNTPIVDGLISFQTDDNFIYMDNGDTREAFGGVKVIPNPEEQPTEVLRNLQIADDVYKISGGHEIEDQSGDTLTQRDKMRFTGAYSHDDSTSEVTKIDIVREMTVSQKDSLSGDEIEGFQWTTDENDELPLTTDWVEYRDGQSATEAIDKCIKQVIDDGGDDLTNREDIQFEGVYTYDDDTEGSEKTVVSIVREFSTVAEIEALTGEAKKGFQVKDGEGGYFPYTGSDILFDKTGTSFTGDNVQDVLEEVDDKYNGTLIKFIPANTYNTYALALTELETYYNGLTAGQKRHSVIKLNSNVTARFFLDNGRYSYCTIGGTTAYIVSLALDAHSYEMANLTTNGITFTNNSSQPQAMSLELWVI